jgi:hypothetical protein
MHDLFLDKHYAKWKENLFEQPFERWYSLIVELDKNDASLVTLKSFNEAIYSKLVYRILPSPNYRKTGEILILFNVSGLLWHGLIHLDQEHEKMRS